MTDMFDHPIYTTRTPIQRPALRVGTTALLLVDLQRYAADPEFGFGRRAREHGLSEEIEAYFASVAEMLPRVQRLLHACRSAGLQVIYVRIEAATADGRDMLLKYRLQGRVIPKGSPEAEILPEVAPERGDIVLSKTSSSAFNSTTLRPLLGTLGIERLIVAGIATHACVEMTVRDGADLGFWIDWVGDACTAALPQLHADALARNQGGLIDVTTTEQILKLVAEAAAQPGE